MSVGLFITFEGGEGAGKSTLISHLKAELQKQGREVLAVREPEIDFADCSQSGIVLISRSQSSAHRGMHRASLATGAGGVM